MGTARFNHHRAGVPVKLAAALVCLVFELGIGVRATAVVVWD
jgi:hypothetical protein